METLAFLGCALLVYWIYEAFFFLIKIMIKPKKQTFSKFPDGSYYLGGDTPEYDQKFYDEQIWR